MEGTHGQLSAGLADRLCCDDANGLTELDHLASSQRTSIAHSANAKLSVAGEDGPNTQTTDVLIFAKRFHLLIANNGVARQSFAPVFHRLGELGVLQQSTTVELGLNVRPSIGRVWCNIFDPNAKRRAAVLFADDELLGDVNKTTRQVTRISSTQRRVNETLAGTRRGDEVLEGL